MGISAAPAASQLCPGHTPMPPSKNQPRDPSPPSLGLTCALLMERMGGCGSRTQEGAPVLHEPKAWRGACTTKCPRGQSKWGHRTRADLRGSPRNCAQGAAPPPAPQAPPGRSDEAGGTGPTRGARMTAPATSVRCCPFTSAECSPPRTPGGPQGSVVLPRDPPDSVVLPRLHQGWSVWPAGCGRMDSLLSPRSDANKSSASFGIPGVTA